MPDNGAYDDRLDGPMFRTPAELAGEARAWLDANPDAPLLERVCMAVVILTDGDRHSGRIIRVRHVAEQIGEDPLGVAAALAALDEQAGGLGAVFD